MKDFIVLGPKTACQYQNIFPLLKERNVHIGKTHPSKFSYGEEEMQVVTNWYNTMGVHSDRALVLTEKYTPEKYPKYDNFEAIEVGRVKDIPYDYNGLMGVPVSIFDYDYENCIEVVGLNNDSRTNDFKYLMKGTPVLDKNGVPRFGVSVNGKLKYTRVVVEIVGYVNGCKTQGAKYLLQGEGTPNKKGTIRYNMFCNGKEMYSRALIKKK